MASAPLTATIRRTARLGTGLEHTLDLARGRDVVPAVWITPEGKAPAPVTLLLHGFSSAKERMAHSVGRDLLKRGVASLALDLPFHGERSGTHGTLPTNPLAIVGAWRAAVDEVDAAVEWLAAQPSVDAERIGIMGYSLGGFLALMTAADEPRLRVVALAAAGDLPDQTPYAALVRSLIDPLRAARQLAGRPLLLVNGRRDTTTRPAQAERLHAAAGEPKSLVWYDGGHWPPPSAIEGAAEWVARELFAVRDARGQSERQAG
jgi:dienelactone hydrolase